MRSAPDAPTTWDKLADAMPTFAHWWAVLADLPGYLVEWWPVGSMWLRFVCVLVLAIVFVALFLLCGIGGLAWAGAPVIFLGMGMWLWQRNARTRADRFWYYRSAPLRSDIAFPEADDE